MKDPKTETRDFIDMGRDYIVLQDWGPESRGRGRPRKVEVIKTDDVFEMVRRREATNGKEIKG